MLTLKTKLQLFVITLIVAIFFLGCKKDINSNSTTTPLEIPDLTSTINSSVSGFVTDENNAAVQGAEVKAGTAAPAMTDEYGYFEIKNTNVVKTAAFVTVSKPGYFKGVKTWGTTEGKAAFFRIKLLTKTIAGTISATAGGSVSLASGLNITLPSNAVVVAADNTAYTGTIHVAASWLDPQGQELTQIMPGDLRGIDKKGEMKGLTTFGMAAVELTNDAGELLQIAPGSKATITMPLSSLLSAAAPASIPLWYFNEANGLWKEDGSAVKTGNSYIGEVSHFSYWNCDLPNATVPLTFTVTDQNGNGIGGAHVEIIPTTSNSWSHIGGFTDSSGYVSLFVTPNASYTLTVISSVCYLNTPEYSQTFSSGTTAIDLGNIALLSANYATVTGTVTDCNNAPVTNGHIFLLNNYEYQRHTLDHAGAYNFSTMLCTDVANVTFFAQDDHLAQQSDTLSYSLQAGNSYNIGNLQACGTDINQFIDYTIDGVPYAFTYPGDAFTSYHYIGSDFPFYYDVSASSYDSTGALTGQAVIEFPSQGVAVNSTQELFMFRTFFFGTSAMVGNYDVHITEFGNFGGFISGYFSGQFWFGTPYQAHTVTCNFRFFRPA